MAPAQEEENKEESFFDKISNAMVSGGTAVARGTGMVVGYSGKFLSTIKDKTANISLPSLPSLPVKGIFSGGVLKSWGSEKANIKVNIAKTKQKIEELYNEIGKQGARLSGVEDIAEHESIKKLIDEVKSCESQIQRWEDRLKELGREQAEVRRKKPSAEADVAPGAVGDIKGRIRDRIDQDMKATEFENSSEKAIFDKVTHDLLDDDDEIRLLAAAELGKIAKPASIPVLKEAIGYKNVYLTSEIINALININDPSCLPIFQSNVKDENYRIRLGSLRGIYKLGGPDSVPYLTDALKDEHTEVRKSAVTMLGWVGVKDAAPALIQALKDSDQEVKKAAAMSLSILRDPASIMPLIRTLGESSIEVREKIVHAIERIADKAVEFKIDASGDELKTNIEKLKAWWQKNEMADVEEVLEETGEEAGEERDVEEEVVAAEASGEEETIEVAGDGDDIDEKTATAETETLTEEKLQRMLKKDLLDKCEELGVEYSSEETKTVLIEKILKQCGN
jgi:HEAT repeat protein